MTGTVLDLTEELTNKRESLALVIARKWSEFEGYRSTWMTQTAELRNYLFATDTKSTTNKQTPWKNSTTMPKLTQIRDNLHANYVAALFPNADWLSWEGDDLSDETEAKRGAIEAYMRTKLHQDRAEIVFSRMLLDYIDYGNCFATVEWVDESVTDPITKVVTRGYVGPRPVRISPFDIVFNPTVASFASSPKIIRALVTLGELAKKAKNLPAESLEKKLLTEALEKSAHTRGIVQSMSQGDSLKAEGFMIDGFSSIQNYYGSDYVELLTFLGDLYDVHTGELLENHIVTVMDRCYVVDKRPNPNWTTSPGVFHAGWRLRPDNLYAMGPLDNLVGMQYRIDHLENLKADVFDIIAYPMLKIKGYVEAFQYAPGNRIFVGDDGDVEFMHPDVTVLNADAQIEVLERRMEEMAGAPREAMGIRSPGEKTKFEVQVLDNASSRIFLNKITHFEKTFFELVLNYMLLIARRNMSSTDVVRTLDSELDAVIFSTITKEDIAANGVLRPRGASHFAQRANALQNAVTLLNSAVAQDEAVKVHLSGKKIAQMFEELSDLKEFKIFGDNIRVMEMSETQRLMAAAGEQTEVAGATPPGITEGDPAVGPIG